MDNDLKYMRSIRAGKMIVDDEDAPKGFHETTPPPEVLLQDAQTPEGYNRDCWPNNCGPGRGPWQDRQTALPTGVTHRRFQDRPEEK